MLRKGGHKKETMSSASSSAWEKAAPLALALEPDNSALRGEILSDVGTRRL